MTAVSLREIIYYSRRLDLVRRDLSFIEASKRARRLAQYMERRCG